MRWPKRPGERREAARAIRRVGNLENRFVASGSGIQFDIDNVGDSLQVETTGPVPTDFSQPYASRNSADDGYGTALNVNGGMLLTGPADSFFNSGNPILDIEHYFSTGGYGAYGQLIQVEDATPGGSGGAIGLQIIAGSDGSGAAEALIVRANQGSDGTNDAFGGEFSAGNLGSGREVALSLSAVGHKTGANSLALECVASGGGAIFQIRDNGEVHIKTGTAPIADLP